MTDPFSHLLGLVAERILGQPQYKSAREWRYGKHGSLSIDIAAGRWYDHENQIGGGVIDFIVRHLPCNAKHEALTWLETQGLLHPRYDDNQYAISKVDTRPHQTEYVYRGPDGVPRFAVRRYRNNDGSKTFKQFRYEDGEFKAGVKGVEFVPYRINEVQAEINSAVLIVEGEKDVDAAWLRGYCATCNAGGSGKWRDSFSEYLIGRTCIVLPDNDHAGRKHAAQVITSVIAAGGDARLLELPDVPEKGDLSDWFNANPDVDLHDLLGGAIVPDERTIALLAEGKSARPTIGIINTPQFVQEYVAPSYLVDGLILKNRLYSMTGRTGDGKTAVALALAFAIARGSEIDGRKTEQGRVLYLAAENPDDIRMRVILMLERLGLEAKELDQLLFVDRAFDLTTGLYDLGLALSGTDPIKCVFVDTGAAFLAHTAVEDENSNLALLRFALALRALTGLPGAPSVVALMHPTKGATRPAELLPRGGGAFLAEVDGNLTVHAEDEVVSMHWAGKLRGPTFSQIPFQLESGTCEGLVDAEGRQVPAVWAQAIEQDRADAKVSQQRKDEDELMAIMKQAPDRSIRQWADYLGWAPNHARVQRALKRLEPEHFVTNERGKWRLTEKGRKEAGK